MAVVIVTAADDLVAELARRGFEPLDEDGPDLIYAGRLPGCPPGCTRFHAPLTTPRVVCPTCGQVTSARELGSLGPGLTEQDERNRRGRLLWAAVTYAGCGWPVFPTEGKRPLAAAAPHGLRSATTDLTTARSWWQRWPDAGVAIVTGAVSGLVVVDVDGDEGVAALKALEAEHGALPRTRLAQTGGGGWHLLFAHPGVEVRNSAGRLGPGLDVRGDGGYVIAPPSPHPSGSTYRWIRKREPLPAPEWLLTSMRPPATAPRPHAVPAASVRASTPWATAALRGEVEAVAGAQPGTRNATLNAAGFRLGQLVGEGLLDEQDVVHALLDAATACGLPDGEARRTLLDRPGSPGAVSAGQAHPRRSAAA